MSEWLYTLVQAGKWIDGKFHLKTGALTPELMHQLRTTKLFDTPKILPDTLVLDHPYFKEQHFENDQSFKKMAADFATFCKMGLDSRKTKLKNLRKEIITQVIFPFFLFFSL